ncbi:wax ester synthase/diacylglycerol acyltransferase 4-like isoform X1 [Rhododendron vialii]|uniref:wax ester synthase/diacylglycerol acyltransferase 4-like isoform X1 n=1 Tax=Rhododendron vialii TaxID=182163 RepID=UPI00265F5ED4|nr:wax ester synthase/diacylglycerol acyltransferase 4-like isoform X1 [Rhododendron vialii]XP_058217781.1 wax ester synthase/diacylglycerol acyltransferase 4-like isoform X1 [Rhododendron vialii]XP_058217782.1 wax ester synthase/diacylglycerol acyltransferase 4-like isoform X1 [Rhododendron vialii]
MDQYHTEEEDEVLPEMPVSPTGQYFNSSALSLSILAVLESEIPLDDSQTLTLLKDVFLPINPRFSSIMVGDKNGVKKWKRVEVTLEDHINVPSFPVGMSPEFYDECFNDYMTKISLERLPLNKPLWEIHIIKYPTSNAAGTVIFKLHHALGDGFSLMGALLSCLQRADNPSLPLTFPSRESSSKRDGKNKGIFRCLGQVFSGVANTVSDFGSTLIKSRFTRDGLSPIRSGGDGVEFRPSVITTLTFSLDHIKQIKAKLGVTINDVIVGVIFLGTRLYMQASSSSHDDEQQQGNANANATALVVLNTRAIGGYKTIGEMVKPNSEMPWGNQFTFLHITIPKLKHSENDDQTNSNPIRFVKKAHRMIKRKRNSAAVYLTGRMLEILRKFRGPEVAAQYVYNTLNSSSIAMSNLIGPVEQMALANHPVKGLYFTLVGGPESLAITIMSYVGKLRITIRMEKGFIDPPKLNSCIENAFDMIFKATVDNTPPSNT